MRATEARRHWGKLLDEVEKGRTVTITRHGRIVARMVPVQATADASYRKAVERFRRLRAEWEPIGMSLEEMIRLRHEGHRF